MKHLQVVAMMGLVVAAHGRLWPAVVGTNPPALALTAERIAALPEGERAAWSAYAERSRRQRLADRAFFADELKAHGIAEWLPAPHGQNARSLPLDKPSAWYGGAEARGLAEAVVSFQTPAGGWSKNLDFSAGPRAAGQRFAIVGVALLDDPADNDRPADPLWNYAGTFDNDATVAELRYLAKVAAARPGAGAATFREAFGRGLDYVLAAQYPNGGWPQVWPLEGRYHDAITFNDGATVNILRLLREVAGGENEFAFATAAQRARAAEAFSRGLACVLACQIVDGGRRTVWCQQHDMLTLAPCSARNYEMPCAASAESAEIALLLMELRDPEPGVAAAVDAAVEWFGKTAVRGRAYLRTGGGGGRLAAEDGAEPLWARCYGIGTDAPVFGDRDKSIHDGLEELSPERRDGYAWYNDSGRRVLERHARWKRPGIISPAR